MRKGWVREQILTIRATLYRFDTPPHRAVLSFMSFITDLCMFLHVSTQNRDTPYSGGGLQKVHPTRWVHLSNSGTVL
jgi:hypothetical protein